MSDLTMTAVQAVSTTNFVGSIGVNTKLTWLDSAYYAPGINILAELQYLGVQNIRQDASTVFQETLTEDQLLATNNIKFDFNGKMPIEQEIASLESLEQLAPDSVIAVEGLNESPVADLPSTLAYQKVLYNAVISDPLLKGVQVYNYTELSFDASAYTAEGNVSSSATTGNTHSYPSYMPPYLWDSWFVPRGYLGTPGLPKVVTETGFDTANTIAPGAILSGGCTQDVSAKYILDSLFDLFQMGVQTTYLYELMDSFNDPTNTINEDAFGLFTASGAPKESAIALHNLTTILNDNGSNAKSFSTGSLSYSVQGLNSVFPVAQAEAYFGYGILGYDTIVKDFPVYGNSMLLEKSNGNFDLAVWQEPEIWDPATNSEVVAPNTPVTITLAQAAASVEVFDPLNGSTPIQTLTDVTTITVGVTDHPLILEIDPFRPISVSQPQDTFTIDNQTDCCPLTGFAISDPNPNAVDVATVSIDDMADGTIIDPNATTDGSQASNGVWTASGSASHLSDLITHLLFAPSSQQTAAGPTTTTIVATVKDPVGHTASTSTTISILPASPTATVDVGSGSDTIALEVSEDFFEGNAQFTVDVDGQQIGGVETATAQDKLGQTQTFRIHGNFLASSQAVTVHFLNDDYAGTPSTDRNLYVLSASENGAVISGSELVLMDNRPQTLFTHVATPGPIAIGSGPDHLSLTISEQNFLGDTQFEVLVDGQEVGDAQTSTALKTLNQQQVVDVEGSFSPGMHSVELRVVNPFSISGYALAQRGVYITEASIDGAVQTGSFPSSVISQSYSFSFKELAQPISVGAASSSNVTTDAAPVHPFASVVITDVNAGQAETVKVVLANTANGTLSDPNAATDGSSLAAGVWTDTGSAASVAAALNALVFTPSQHQVAPGQSVSTLVTATVSDTAGQTATLSSTVKATATASPIGMAEATSSVSTTDAAPVHPFASVVITDVNAGQAETVKVVLANTANGTLSDPNAATDGSSLAAGVWTDTGSAASVAAALNALVFTPSQHQVAPGQSVSTLVTATVSDTAGQTATLSSTVKATATASPIVLGQGPDNLSLVMAQKGASVGALFNISVDGVQVGQTQTVTADMLQGQSQTFDVLGNFGNRQHTVTVAYLNANNSFLYINSANINGVTIANSNRSLGNVAPKSFTFVGSTTSSPTVVGTGPDTLSLYLAERAQPSGAKFNLTVDGKQVGQTQSVTADVLTGQTQQLAVQGNFGPGSHAISLAYINASNSLLFVEEAAINGSSISGSQIVLSNNGTMGMTFFTPPTPTPVNLGNGPDILSLHISEAYNQGNAMFTLAVDGRQVGGVQTTTAINQDGQSQIFNMAGNYTGSHTLTVNLLAGQQTPSANSSTTQTPTLFIGGVTVDGTGSSAQMTLTHAGLSSFSFIH